MKVGELLQLAATGDRTAWDTLVERYEGMLWGIARSHRLDEASASDVVQTTWLRLVEHVDALRNPDALAGWLATTARNECLRVLRNTRREVPMAELPAGETVREHAVDDHWPTASECEAALAKAMPRVSARQRALVETLMQDPAPSYEQVSAQLRIPIGSIGPTRGRCLARLRRDPHIADLFSDSARPVRPTRPVRSTDHDLM
jgi:RNA polymerase sigma factor (sigma-70 family)